MRHDQTRRVFTEVNERQRRAGQVFVSFVAFCEKTGFPSFVLDEGADRGNFERRWSQGRESALVPDRELCGPAWLSLSFGVWRVLDSVARGSIVAPWQSQWKH